MKKRAILALILLGCASPASVPCSHTEAQLRVYRASVDGPAVLAAIVGDDSESEASRLSAALGLIEMDRRDVDGLAMLTASLEELDVVHRTLLLNRLSEPLVEGLAVDGSTASADRRQERMVEAATMIAGAVDHSARQALGAAVMGWLARSPQQRLTGGTTALADVIEVFGPSALRSFAEAVELQRGAESALVLIAGRADSQTRALVAGRLLAAELEMSRSSGLPGRRPERSYEAPKMGRSDLIAALGNFTTDRRVVDRLLEIGAHREAPSETSVVLRSSALRVLVGHAQTRHFEALLALALDESAPAMVRDDAFDCILSLRDPRTVTSMWPLVATTGERWRLRWRAAAIVLSVGGSDALAELLNRLPDQVEYAREELFSYVELISGLEPPPLAILRESIRSPRWQVRVISLLALGAVGTSEDRGALRSHLEDETRLVGDHWDPLSSVAELAAEALQRLIERSDD